MEKQQFYAIYFLVWFYVLPHFNSRGSNSGCYTMLGFLVFVVIWVFFMPSHASLAVLTICLGALGLFLGPNISKKRNL